MAACEPSYRKYFVVNLECAETSGLGNPDPSWPPKKFSFHNFAHR